MTPAIAISALSVRLGSTDVLRGLDLEVAGGEWLNIIGPNGAGKTTLLRALLGSVKFSGEIRIDGLDGDGDMSRARAVAYVPQNPVIPPGMAVVDYVLLGRTPHRGVFSGDSVHDIDIASRVLDRLDLRRFAERELRSLSGGERQRAVMARALVQETSLLLLDEPTAALDLGNQQEVLDLIEELRHERGLTVVATLHDLTLAARYGDRIAMLADGRIVDSGPAATVLNVQAIATHFGANVRIIDDAGGPVIVPIHRR